jgi:hypothetical protein
VKKTDRLNALFVRWKEFYRQNGLDPDRFSSDGIIDEERYLKAKRKILFVLRETNEFGGDLCKLIRQGHRHNIFSQLSKWAAGILNDFPEFEEINCNRKVRTEALESIALLNLKKLTGTQTSVPALLHAFSLLDKSYIIEEIDIIKPEVIVSCSTFTELIWVLDLDEIKCHLPDMDSILNSVYHHSSSSIVFWQHHPAGRRKHEDNYNDLKDLFRRLKL